MYAKCGSMVEARQAFDTIDKPDVVSWTSLLLGYAENGEGSVVLDLLSRMKASGLEPDCITYVAAFKACASLVVSGNQVDCLERGRQMHSEISCRLSESMLNALMDMYAKCGSMVDARCVFDSIQNPDVVSWNTLLLGYAENGEGSAALELFNKMKATRGCTPTPATLVAALKACIALASSGNDNGRADCLEWGRAIHLEISSHLDHHLQSTLIDMYSKCGRMVEARRVFDMTKNPNVVSWNVLLLGYAENGEGQVALDLFSRMKAHGVASDTITYVAALKACTSLSVLGCDCLESARRLHSEIGRHLDHRLENMLVDLYSKCGSMDDARCVFDNMKKPDVVSWNALLLGYAENGGGRIALEMFLRMKQRGCVPSSVTYVAAVKACACLGELGDARDGLERGRQIHSEIGCYLNQSVQNALVDMYSKCGSMVDACSVFDDIRKPDVISWTSLLLGYVENGEGNVALDLFSRMKERGYVPSPVTYIAALKACTFLATNGDRSGCLKRGKEIHLEVGCSSNQYLQSTLMDMYCKCGSMVDARLVFESIRKPDVVSWNALLLGYVENGEGKPVLDLFYRMKAARGSKPNSVTYIAALKACGCIGDLALGRRLHSDIQDFTVHVVTCLVDFYSKCGSLKEAREVFDLHPKARNVATWNALLAGHAASAGTSSVFGLFEKMKDTGFRPDGVTFLSLLLCCSHAGLVEKARMYFEAMEAEHGVAPTIVHYTCMVDVLGRVNQLSEAIALLRRMPCQPHATTWKALLAACHKWKSVELAKMVFQASVGVDMKDAPAHVLMAHIYGSASAWTTGGN